MGVAVRAAQLLLKTVEPSLKVDGFWGPKTEAAFAKAPDSLKAQVRAIFKEGGKVIPNESRWISRERAEDIVRSEAAALGMGQHADALCQFLAREARKRNTGGGVEYDINSRNGRSTGLMQMQPAAWMDAKRRNSSIGEFADDVYDPRMNIRAGIIYASINAPHIVKAGYPVNADTLYLAHNQGVGYFVGNHVTGFDGQSAEVRQLIKKYMVGRTPVFHGDHSKW